MTHDATSPISRRTGKISRQGLGRRRNSEPRTATDSIDKREERCQLWFPFSRSGKRSNASRSPFLRDRSANCREGEPHCGRTRRTSSGHCLQFVWLSGRTRSWISPMLRVILRATTGLHRDVAGGPGTFFTHYIWGRRHVGCQVR
jgi:hypothetical protein